MGRPKDEWGWPDVRTGECAASSGRMDRHEEPEDDAMAELAAWDPMGRRARRDEGFGDDGLLPATLTDADVGVNVMRGSRHAGEDIGGQGPLTDADVGVNVYRRSRGDEGGISEYVVRGSSVGDEWLEALMREDYGVAEEEGVQVALDWKRIPKLPVWAKWGAGGAACSALTAYLTGVVRAYLAAKPDIDMAKLAGVCVANEDEVAAAGGAVVIINDARFGQVQCKLDETTGHMYVLDPQRGEWRKVMMH